MPNRPLAYFLTWTTYGSWLHGDARGSVAPGVNETGTPTLLRDDFRRGFEERRMRGRTVSIDHTMRALIERTISETCEARDWTLIALNVRTQHVHAVVAAEEAAPERVLNSFKSWCTRSLRQQQLLGETERLWTRHGSTRYLWTEDDVAAARSYVAHHQGGRLDGSNFRQPDFE